MSRSLIALIFLAFIPLAFPPTTEAAEFFIDPLTGSPTGTGAADDPWRTLEQVFADGLIQLRRWQDHPPGPDTGFEVLNPDAPVRGGDTLWLLDGYHGEIDVRSYYNTAPIKVVAAPGHAPRLGRLHLQSAQHWTFRGLSISPAHAQGPVDGGSIVQIEGHGFWGPASDVVFEDLDIFTIDDAGGWGIDEWLNEARSGVSLRADRAVLRGSRVRNVRHGITATGDDVSVLRNHVDGFSADGMRGLGDGGRFEYNRIQNNYISSSQGDGNHDDGFQSWSVGPGGVGTGEVRDVVLRSNIFINHVDPDHPLRSTMQAIGCFDGLFVNWVVENNVIITDHWHGITFHGMIDSRVVNNTVLDINDETPGPPWIRLTESNGRPSRNVVVRNNLSTRFTLSGEAIVDDHNVEIEDAGALFLAPPYDLRLLPTASAVDTGSGVMAPTHDVLGLRRPQGAAHDIGAYERCPNNCLIFSDGFEDGTTGAWSFR
ncbi:MAG: choice-of-anchor Q domain-containing protein [Acidobacteriota bacterium]